MSNKKSSRLPLPQGYTEVEYIQSTGTQCIDTGVIPDWNTKLVLDASIISISEKSVLFGTGLYEGGSQSRDFQLISYAPSGSGTYDSFRAWYLGYYYKDLSINASLYPYSDRKTYILSNQEFKIGSRSASDYSPEYTTKTGNTSIALCAVNYVSGGFSLFSKIKIYSCQIYDTDNLIRDFVPCKNQYGSVGLYDLVGNQFYVNSGTGEFLQGPVVIFTPVKPKIWEKYDIPSVEEMEEYLARIKAARDLFQEDKGFPELPPDMNHLTYESANNIELTLLRINELIKLVKQRKTRIYSGELQSGGL